jgi:hypothetical protein
MTTRMRSRPARSCDQAATRRELEDLSESPLGTMRCGRHSSKGKPSHVHFELQGPHQIGFLECYASCVIATSFPNRLSNFKFPVLTIMLRISA